MTSTNPSSDVLERCPFCGKEDSADNAVQESPINLTSFKAASGGYALRVTCACGAAGKSSYDATEAIAAWNARSDATIERLSAELERIANFDSGVSDNHMECGECKDAYLGPFCDVRDIARAALTDPPTNYERTL